MKGAVRETYNRALPFIRAVPLAAAIVAGAEFAQHVVEIRIGMYAPDALVTRDEQRLRLFFGAVKILAILLTILFAVRWWAFGGDTRRAAWPTVPMFKGLSRVILVQIGGELLLLGIGALLARLAGAGAGQGARLALAAGPLLLWLLLETLLLPWFVGLLTEDRSMTLRRSIRAVSGRIWAAFGVLLMGYLPAIALHYAIGFAALGREGPVVWLLMLLDSAVVAVLAVLLASTYFTIYRRAAERSAG